MSLENLFYCIATVPEPFETLCAKEISLLGAKNVTTMTGAVGFFANDEVLYRVNLCSSIPNRILVKLVEFPCADKEKLYREVTEISFEEWFAPSASFAIYTNGTTPLLRNTMFSSLVVKDALVDRFNKIHGVRPSVDKENPDIIIQVFFEQRRENYYCSIFIDSSLAPLYQRGYRSAVGDAPLKETLAAALVTLCEERFQREVPVIDLFCGSGTLLIELALRRLHYPVGRLRNFGFMKWKKYDEKIWHKVFESAHHQRVDVQKTTLCGTDISAMMIEKAKANALGADVSSYIRWQCCDFGEVLKPFKPGYFVLNPPYGHRLSNSQELVVLYQRLGQMIREKFSNWDCYLLTTEQKFIEATRLQLQKQWKIKNGDLDTKFCLLTV